MAEAKVELRHKTVAAEVVGAMKEPNHVWVSDMALVAQAVANAEANSPELRKHQDLVEALSWLPAGTVVDFYDLDDFLEEMRAKPTRWLPERECKHTSKYPRCIKCRNEAK